MSMMYDIHLARHKTNVSKAFDWISNNLPELLSDCDGCEWNIKFAHDASKTNPDEYEPYDNYFYGNNRSYHVVQEFNKAWLLHIHRNPHHWQYWVLINDDPNNGTIILDMPHDYILEMVCDWWSFSWEKGNLNEIFKWYSEHKDYMKLSRNTRKTVEDILDKIKAKIDNEEESLCHHGVKGQKWGVKNGPPYPIDRSDSNIVKDAIESGLVSKKINREKQMRHTKDGHTPGRSYINGDLEYAQELVDELSGTGSPVSGGDIKQWNHRERVTASHDIGVYVDADGNETASNNGMIVYSKTGTHIYPVRKESLDED